MLRATPFHTRTAEANRNNAWRERNGVTLASHFGDARDEALAARFSVVMADISWRWRLAIPGNGAAEALARLFTRDARMLSPGSAFKALWLNDRGAVRDAGVLAREHDDDGFLFAAAAPDAEWIEAAAQAFGLAVRDLTMAQGGIAVMGPYAEALLRAAGLDETIAPLGFRRMAWRGIAVVVSRWGEHGGYEIWCDAEDGLVVWDRLVRAGAPFGLRLAGLEATDILDIEAGVARPGRDYRPARDAYAAAPQPRALGLERLIDEAHLDFVGRNAFLAARAAVARTLVGLVFDSETPAPHTEILREGAVVGRTFSAVYSPALRRAIALAEIDIASANSSTALTVTLPTSADAPLARAVTARVADLPLVPASAPVQP
jgi:aminomethyltransferase